MATDSATADVTSVASSATVVTLLEARGAREGLLIYNASTAILYVKFGATATTSDYSFQLAAGAFYENGENIYTGKITGIWASANGAAKITELTN